MATTTLLLVDDSDVDRYITQRLLTKAGCDARIVEVENGREALDWLRDNRIPADDGLLILLDLNMPVMGGFEFLLEFAALREQRVDLQPGVVAVLSSSNHPDDLHRSGAFPFVWRHLVKMPTVDALADIVRQARTCTGRAYA